MLNCPASMLHCSFLILHLRRSLQCACRHFAHVFRASLCLLQEVHRCRQWWQRFAGSFVGYRLATRQLRAVAESAPNRCLSPLDSLPGATRAQRHPYYKLDRHIAAPSRSVIIAATAFARL